MSARADLADGRESRELTAWDEDGVAERCDQWMKRALHVLTCVNSKSGEREYERSIATRAPGARALDLGCGGGHGTSQLVEYRASSVVAIDLSRSMIAQARRRVGAANHVEFRRQSVAEPLAETFDLVVGRAILHHVDFRELLVRVYRDNLLAGGRMVFMEPAGHPMTIAFHRLVRAAHSPDERPLRRSDMEWVGRQFPQVAIRGINLLSFPAGVISTRLFPSPENRLMRFADRADSTALARVPSLAGYARQAVLVIDKPA